MIRFTLRLLSGLLFGVILSLWIIQNNSDVQHAVTNKLITALEKEWNVKIATEGSTINFFTFSLYLKKGAITPTRKRQFGWQFGECKIHISPFALLDYKIELYLTFANTKGHTGYNNGSFDLAEHLGDIFTTSPSDKFKIVPKTITLYNINIDVALHGKTITLDVPGTFKIAKSTDAKVAKLWDGSLDTTNAMISIDQQPVITKITGSNQFHNHKKDLAWHFATNTHFKTANIDTSNTYALKGQWNPGTKHALITDTTKSISLVALQHQQDIAVTGTLPLDKVINLVNVLKKESDQKTTSNPLRGTCTVDLKLSAQDFAFNGAGAVTITNIRYNDTKIPDIALNNIIMDSAKIKTELSANTSEQSQLSGKATWKFGDEAGDLKLTNTAPIKLGAIVTSAFDDWVVKPRGFFVSLHINKNVSCSGDYRLKLLNQVTEKKEAYQGTYFINNQGITLSGKNNFGHYMVEGSFIPHLHLTTWSYTKRDKKIVELATSSKHDTMLTGIIHYSLIKSFLDHSVKRMVWGNNCSFSVVLDQSSFTDIKGSLQLNEGRFYIPENRNLIEKLKTDFTFNMATKKITLKDFLIGFSKGTVSSPQATIYLADDYSLGMVHIPAQIDNLFVNWKRDFYGFIYGNLLLNKLPGCPPKLSGNIVLKKSLLRENIFSEGVSTNFYGPMGTVGSRSNLGFDIRITTEKPIKARTPALEAYAALNLRIQYLHNQDLVQAPHVTGTVHLENGYLKFLRSKLFIEYGRIHFITNQMNDPIIDLVAKNRINKYLITLQATGSLQKPNLILESTPELTEEQILGLILAGSENATLQADLPAMLMQNLSNIILGSKQHLPKATTFFEKITKPFKYVQITPNFSDQSGRGGIKGIVSIDVNEQLHAQIQKNFNLQEDFSAQVEYLLSDDINIKVVKDQRGELGSEVEVRLKL